MKKRTKPTKMSRNSRVDKETEDLIKRIHAGTVAIQTFGDLAGPTITSDRVLEAMCQALFNNIRQAKPGVDDEAVARLIGYAMAAACEYGRSRANSKEQDVNTPR